VPTVSENKHMWDGDYLWSERGDEWSLPWGTVPMQWYTTIMPRIHNALPAARILEIACGYGRWTQYLKDQCDRLIVVDLSAECIEACKRRFANSKSIEYHVTDGKSLSMVPDRSIDFIFSFDSLVHADRSVLRAYIEQFGRVLSPAGTAFIHHSNLGEYRTKYRLVRAVPKLEGLLRKLGACEFHHWRDAEVTAPFIARLAESNGLTCIVQEMVNWRTRHELIDCISTIVRQDATHGRTPNMFRNDRFMDEVDNAKRLAQHYSASLAK